MELKRRTLPDKTIHFWYCDFNLHKDKLGVYTALLSVDEKQKAGRFKFEKDRQCYIITRGILRCLLGDYLNKSPNFIDFRYTSFAKPYLANESSIKFNVSHSGNRAVFAFCLHKEIGVDIEKIKNDFNLLELAQNFFSLSEIEALEKQSSANLPNAFYRCWTRKEAFIKAEGSGLSFPLDKFTVSLDDDHKAAILETAWDREEKNKWQLFSYPVLHSFIAAVAVKSTPVQIEYLNFDE